MHHIWSIWDIRKYQDKSPLYFVRFRISLFLAFLFALMKHSWGLFTAQGWEKMSPAHPVIYEADLNISKRDFFLKELGQLIFFCLPLGSNWDFESSEYMLDTVYLNFLKQTVHLGCNRNALFLHYSSHASLQGLANTNTYLQGCTPPLEALVTLPLDFSR